MAKKKFVVEYFGKERCKQRCRLEVSVGSRECILTHMGYQEFLTRCVCQRSALVFLVYL